MKHDEMVESISRLDQATKHLQSQLDRPKTRFETFKEYAGVASLLVSLIAALYGAFSTLVLDPRKELAEKQARLAQALTGLWSVDMQANQAAQHGDTANIAVLTTQHQKLLQQAETLLTSAGVGGPQDQFSVASEYELVGQVQPALDHFRTAFASAGKDHVLASTAEMRIGQLELRGVGGASAELARRDFDEAQKRLGDPLSASTSVPLYQLLTTRAVIECKYGEAELGLKARDRAEARLTKMAAQDPTIDPNWVAQQRSDLAKV